MTLSKLRPICFVLLILTTISCKKDNSSNNPASRDEIILSINGGADTHYDKSTYNPSTEQNYRTGVDFARTYYTTPDRLSEQYNYIQFYLKDEDLFEQQLPYQVKNKQVFMELLVPGNLGTFAYDSSSNTEKGHVNVTIIGAKGTHLQGTYSGVIYSSYNTGGLPDSLRINGGFDVTLPAYYAE